MGTQYIRTLARSLILSRTRQAKLPVKRGEYSRKTLKAVANSLKAGDYRRQIKRGLHDDVRETNKTRVKPEDLLESDKLQVCEIARKP